MTPDNLSGRQLQATAEATVWKGSTRVRLYMYSPENAGDIVVDHSVVSQDKPEPSTELDISSTSLVSICHNFL